MATAGAGGRLPDQPAAAASDRGGDQHRDRRLGCAHATRRAARMRQQRGIALITAIILVALAAVLATAIGFGSAMSARRASTMFGADQSFLAAEGAEAMAAYVIKQSRGNSSTADS